jgi:hypothetical protein
VNAWWSESQTEAQKQAVLQALETSLSSFGSMCVHLDLEKTGPLSRQSIPGAAGMVSFGGAAAEVQNGLVHVI